MSASPGVNKFFRNDGEKGSVSYTVLHNSSNRCTKIIKFGSEIQMVGSSSDQKQCQFSILVCLGWERSWVTAQEVNKFFRNDGEKVSVSYAVLYNTSSRCNKIMIFGSEMQLVGSSSHQKQCQF